MTCLACLTRDTDGTCCDDPVRHWTAAHLWFANKLSDLAPNWCWTHDIAYEHVCLQCEVKRPTRHLEVLHPLGSWIDDEGVPNGRFAKAAEPRRRRAKT